MKRGQLYVWRGEVESREGRRIYVKSTISELETGGVCAEVIAVMVTVKWEHKMGQVFHYLFRKDQEIRNEIIKE